MRVSTPAKNIDRNKRTGQFRSVVPKPVSPFDHAIDDLIVELKRRGIKTVSTARWCTTPGGGFINGGEFNVDDGCRIGGHEYGKPAALYYAFLNAEIQASLKNKILERHELVSYLRKHRYERFFDKAETEIPRVISSLKNSIVEKYELECEIEWDGVGENAVIIARPTGRPGWHYRIGFGIGGVSVAIEHEMDIENERIELLELVKEHRLAN